MQTTQKTEPVGGGNNQTKYWTVNGELHREDGPALIEPVYDLKKWYIRGKLHRECGPAVVIKNKYFKWYKNDKLHRENGPAIEWADGGEEWYINGLLHRTNGPAYIKGDEKKYFINGTFLDDHPLSNWLKQRKWYNNFKNGKLTEDQIIEIKFVFGF